ncbi:unnamed protein product [Prorocentrum cordatum]|uniref:Uncharacterized protein n=1 Tax=Prorocentrum cordatum TaxID=2364126 RepID=A0ABN9WL90_9DINO|nr:unnamed protein product [Polarella glacialis]
MDSWISPPPRLGTKWDLVADFSAYDGSDIRASVKGLRTDFRIYAYISSDSVYEVGRWAGEKWKPGARPGGSGPLRVTEEMGTRPEEREVMESLNKADGYGHGKLEAEEELLAGVPQDSDCQLVFLRLPDVIGPYDGTLRLWAYWHWLRAGDVGAPPPQVQAYKRKKEDPSGVPSEVDPDPPLALVFSQDVARFMASLLDRPPPQGQRSTRGSTTEPMYPKIDPHVDPSTKIRQPFVDLRKFSTNCPWIRQDKSSLWGRPILQSTPCAQRADAVNLCCEQQVPLSGVLQLLSDASTVPRKRPRLAPVKSPKTYLPSVDRPWPLDVRRAQERSTASSPPRWRRSCAAARPSSRRGAGDSPTRPAGPRRSCPTVPRTDMALRQAGLDRHGADSDSS